MLFHVLLLECFLGEGLNIVYVATNPSYQAHAIKCKVRRYTQTQNAASSNLVLFTQPMTQKTEEFVCYQSLVFSTPIKAPCSPLFIDF